MKGYSQVKLSTLLEGYGEEAVKSQLSIFACPLNRDVEEFLRLKAIEFANKGLANTHLVYASYKDSPVLVGYYALANKNFAISSKTKLSKTLKKRLNKFAIPPFAPDMPRIIVSPLIAQLGKNYTNGYNRLISGDDLLMMACDKVHATLLELSGKVVYVECEDTPKLVEFYKRNGFHDFDKRVKRQDEKELYHSDYVVQLLKYFS